MDSTEQDKPTQIAVQKSGLVYPFAPPASGQMIEVAPGVRWLRMPLPYSLDHINLWLVDDGEGWAVVDTGVHTEEAMQIWCELLGSSSEARSLTRVFVTHMHPDHIGLAGWLARRFGIRLWMARLEYLTCRVMVSDSEREAPPDAIAFYRRAGWSACAIEAYRSRFGGFGKHIYPLPDSYCRLHDGDVVRIGAHDWHVVVGTGHSPEHACLYCPELALLISGDQVLPRISSNVSVFPFEPDANPMADWLDSLAKLKRSVPDDVLVLPAHGECFRGLHARIDALSAGQQRAFERLGAALATPRRVVDVFGALFARPINESTPMLLGMATGESLACLNYLMHSGRVECGLDGEGVAWYRLRPRALETCHCVP